MRLENLKHLISNKSKGYYFILLLSMIILPIVLLSISKTSFDTGPTTCIFTLFTGHKCLGCGMTRACMRIIHFDIKGALLYNKMSLIVFPIIAFYYAKEFLILLSKFRSF